MARSLFFFGLICFVVLSQLFWIYCLIKLTRQVIHSKPLRAWLAVGGAALYIILLVYNFEWARSSPSPTSLTLQSALIEAPLQWWIVSSLLGFSLVLLFGILTFFFRAGQLACRRLRPKPLTDPPPPQSLNRRTFLTKTALAAGGLPFVACGYGLLYGRLNIEQSSVRIKLARLPSSFVGFRIAQLSDLHISPFMSAKEIRKVVGMTNGLKPDLIVLTGDYVTWDPATQGDVVNALSGLKAPFGIYGCLGNHELWTHTEGSITRLFAGRGIRILRRERTAIQAGGDRLNLIGVDFQTHSSRGRHEKGLVHRYLEGVNGLTEPETVNILLSHNPNTFDRAAEMGIDLSLAGHTHGGQISLEFVQRDLSPARLITPYTRGWFNKPGGQLYVNRGIGTIGVPVRFDSPPEITVFELTRT